jgi:peptidoglycan/xylan/chitin deacetylase (PgdA/CDA1 family)
VGSDQDQAGTVVYLLLTMDCEPPQDYVTEHARGMSSSGPADYRESERSIRGYVGLAASRGFPVTLFVHPEVAAAHRELLLDLQGKGACLGLHVHPYKLRGGRHRCDLGAYSAREQRDILVEAMDAWEGALGKPPRYFRAGYFSANDATFGVLCDLGFRGGSLSNPGRVLPAHQSVWAGAVHYPHRANLAFRQIAGDSEFVEVPVSVATGRPVQRGHAGEAGYEWPYVPHSYDHGQVVREIISRFAADRPALPTLVTDTHNDQDYADEGGLASRNLRCYLGELDGLCASRGFRCEGTTLGALCRKVLLDG